MKEVICFPHIFRTAESFFTGLGLPPMTETFKKKSMIVRPADGRDVVCHASAEDFSVDDDYRWVGVVSQSSALVEGLGSACGPLGQGTGYIGGWP